LACHCALLVLNCSHKQFYTKSDMYNAHRDRRLFYDCTTISIKDDVSDLSQIDSSITIWR